MTFEKILCPIDFSPGSQHAMRVAVRIATASNAELVLAHVWHMPAIVMAGETPFPSETIQLVIEDEEKGLADAQRLAVRLGARRVSTTFVTGVPWDQIVELLRRDPYDLVVMGSHGRTGVGRFLLGSVTEAVVRHAPCPVLAVRGRGEEGRFHHVLCPVDFSEGSRHAVELAAPLAASEGAALTLLHVIEAPLTYSGTPPVTDVLPVLEQRANEMLAQLAASLGAARVTTRAQIGSPASTILGVLDEDPTIDLVVMGSRGRTGLRRVLLGSVAEKLVRHAPCPVLVVRPRPQ